MTLRQLHKRLGDIIADNDARGWGERNEMPAGIVLMRLPTPSGRRRRKGEARFFPIDYVSGAQHTIGGGNYCGVIEARETKEVKP